MKHKIRDGEKRQFIFDSEMRARSDDTMEVEGYALKFDKETVIGGKWGWTERINKAALDEADLSTVVFNFNHSLDSLLAGTRNKSLTLTTDSIGLKINARIVDTTMGRDVYQLIKDGLITQMSFWAVIKTSSWTWANEDDTEAMDEREILSFGRFIDVSAVTFPAYEDTELAARSLGGIDMQLIKQIQYEKQIRKMEKILGGK